MLIINYISVCMYVYYVHTYDTHLALNKYLLIIIQQLFLNELEYLNISLDVKMTVQCMNMLYNILLYSL